MNIESFRESIKCDVPPENLPDLLRALWYDANGDWTTAHNVAQEIDTNNGAWIHAYLHRKEGDSGNADYWYHRAGKQRSPNSLEDEWQQIAESLLTEWSDG